MEVERVKLELEFVIKSSPTILYQYISTPSGLVEWFCDDVNIKGSNNEEYEFLTLMEKEYKKHFKDEYGLWNLQPIKHKVFHIKVPRPPKQKYVTPLEDFNTWVSGLEIFRKRGL